MRVYQQLAKLIQARENCEESGNTDWYDRHQDSIDQIIKELAPSGSGFDSGTTLRTDSSPNKLIFETSYHHMTDGGCYDGWTDHDVIITPDLASGFNMRITGRDRNQIKEYIADCFNTFLDQERAAQ